MQVQKKHVLRMFLKRAMSGSARMSAGKLFQTTGPAQENTRPPSLVRSCELMEHNSLASFQSEDQVAPFCDSQVARRCRGRLELCRYARSA